jgi:hypothetical protein
LGIDSSQNNIKPTPSPSLQPADTSLSPVSSALWPTSVETLVAHAMWACPSHGGVLGGVLARSCVASDGVESKSCGVGSEMSGSEMTPELACEVLSGDLSFGTVAIAVLNQDPTDNNQATANDNKQKHDPTYDPTINSRSYQLAHALSGGVWSCHLSDSALVRAAQQACVRSVAEGLAMLHSLSDPNLARTLLETKHDTENETESDATGNESAHVVEMCARYFAMWAKRHTRDDETGRIEWESVDPTTAKLAVLLDTAKAVVASAVGGSTGSFAELVVRCCNRWLTIETQQAVTDRLSDASQQQQGQFSLQRMRTDQAYAADILKQIATSAEKDAEKDENAEKDEKSGVGLRSEEGYTTALRLAER